MDVYDFSMLPGDSIFFSLDIYPNGEAGSGHWRILMVDSTTMETDSADFQLIYQPVAVANTPVQPRNFKIAAWGPNPTNGALLLRIENNRAGRSSLEIFNLQGRRMLNRSTWLDRGEVRLRLEMPQLSAGVYLLRLSRGKESYTLPLVVAP